MSKADPERRSARPQHKFSAIRSITPPVGLSTPHRTFSFEDVSSSLWMSSRIAVCNIPLDHGHATPVSLRRGGKATVRPKKLPPIPAGDESKAAYANKKLPPIPDLHANIPANVYQNLPGPFTAEAPGTNLQSRKEVVPSEARVAEAHKPQFPKPSWPEESEAKISRWEYYEFKFIKSPLRTLSKKLRRTLKPQFTKFKADKHFTADFRLAQRKLEAVHGKVFSPKFGTTHIEVLPDPSRIITQPAVDAVLDPVPADESVDIEITSWIQDMARTRSDLIAAACTASSSCYCDDMDPSAMPPPLRFSSKRKPAPVRRPSPSWV
ncbi:hypothetical protein MBLNU457_g0286t1 [Dothideomycetes sp. NU457]